MSRFVHTSYSPFGLGSVLFAAMLVLATTSAKAVTIDWSPVGNAGNAADPTTGSLYGAVDYNYRIGTYDVTDNQYVEFLNTKDPTGADPYGLFNIFMSNGTLHGINYRASSPNGSKYTVVPGDGNHPVNYVTWYDAIRFANWLNNGQGNGDTETGAYTLGPLGAGGIPINGSSITRNPGANVFLPSDNEWYKAAYYNPTTSSYYLFPTSSNVEWPTTTSPTASPDSANASPGGPDHLTDVGAYTGTTSPYGVYDMAGNVWQWNEALLSGTDRGIRGASFSNDVSEAISNDDNHEPPAYVPGNGTSDSASQVFLSQAASFLPQSAPQHSLSPPIAASTEDSSEREVIHE